MLTYNTLDLFARTPESTYLLAHDVLSSCLPKTSPVLQPILCACRADQHIKKFPPR